MLQLKTPPTDTPVSLAEAKAQCKLESSDEDDLIRLYISAATEMAEQRTGRSLMPQTWRKVLDAFPGSGIELPRIPVVSVVSVKYLDPTGAEVALGNLAYKLLNFDDAAPATLQPAYGTRWPASRCEAGAVQVEYIAGYPNAAFVPHAVRSWILLQVAAMYENRQAEGGVQTFALGFADRLLDQSKVWSL